MSMTKLLDGGISCLLTPLWLMSEQLSPFCLRCR